MQTLDLLIAILSLNFIIDIVDGKMMHPTALHIIKWILYVIALLLWIYYKHIERKNENDK